MKLLNTLKNLSIIFLTIISTTQCTNKCVLIDDTTGRKYYQDFDFIKLKGINEITTDKKCLPFIAIEDGDDIKLVYIYTKNSDFDYIDHYTKEFNTWKKTDIILTEDGKYLEEYTTYHLDSMNIEYLSFIEKSTNNKNLASVSIIKSEEIKRYFFEENDIDNPRWNYYKDYINYLQIDSEEKINFKKNDDILNRSIVKKDVKTNSIIFEDESQYYYKYKSLFWWNKTGANRKN